MFRGQISTDLHRYVEIVFFLSAVYRFLKMNSLIIDDSTMHCLKPLCISVTKKLFINDKVSFIYKAIIWLKKD